MTLDPHRIETLVIARQHVSPGPLEVRALQRFAPRNLDEPAWRAALEAAVNRVQAQQDADGRVDTAAALASRIGKHTARTWLQLADKILPALALGVRADDTRSLALLAGRDAWAAAITARELGLWPDGPPPRLNAVCDAFAWRELGLRGKPKRLPPEVRALFLQRELATDPGAPARLVRQFAARAVGAPRPDLRALRDALVQRWVQEAAPAPRAAERREVLPDSFAGDVQRIARAAHHGVFGDRKVFIATVWDAFRGDPRWAALSLDEFKARLITEHRSGTLVLARADLVAAMSPELVARSEITTSDASFHFIVREMS